MGMKGILTTFAISCAVAAYIFVAFVAVPSDIENKDDVIWIFARRKINRGLSAIGEILGLGHQIHLYRKSSQLFSHYKLVNYTGVEVMTSEFDGIPVRTYTPVGVNVVYSPAIVWIHGGGWVSGTAASDDLLMVELSLRLHIPVFSINYRLSPEFPYPVPLEDCVKVTVYVLQHADQLGIDSNRIAIGGSSAGGNLAAAVSLKLRDSGSSLRPSLQVLYVPCLQAFDFQTPSYQKSANNAYLPTHWMATYWMWYAFGMDGHKLADLAADNQHTSVEAKTSAEVQQRLDHSLIPRRFIPNNYVPPAVNIGSESVWNEVKSVLMDAYFAPLMASDLRSLPPAFIATAEHDVLRDDGIMYAKRLEIDGVSVEHRNYEHSFHDICPNIECPSCQAFVTDLVDFLSNRL